MASTASSSSSFVFPPSSSPTKANAHPYAIKTTSTGILSRSNSTHSTASSTHRFVPSSPQKPKHTHSNSIGQGHKYSRSLTGELPRPLPVPPNFPSPSPTKSEFDNDAVFASGRGRADTLPSDSAPPEFNSNIPELPLDPREWTSSDLSTYLASSLRVTSGDLPPLVAQDMAAFVRREKINGKRFLRLNGQDMENYGLNQRWQTALLSASRALRQDSLRGRVWNSMPTSNSNEEDEVYSSTSSSGSVNIGRRNSGRVKGMVASFERGSSIDLGHSSRSVSPDKNDRRSISPVKKSRSRPNSDIFPSNSSLHAMPEEREREKDQDQDHHKEPRLLPYPPSSPSVPMSIPPVFPSSPPIGVPAPGFPSGVLPFSPQSTGSTSLDMSMYETVRPLPLPPHMGQVYQPPMQGYGGVVGGGMNINNDGILYPPVAVPHVQMGVPQHVQMQLAQSPGVNVQQPQFDLLNSQLDHHYQQQQETQHSISQLYQQPLPQLLQQLPQQLQQLPQQPQQPHLQQPQQPQQPLLLTIHAPQPIEARAPGSESPSKVLEQKLEELLEPRPRSRIISGVSPASSRPRSRVASQNMISASPSHLRNSSTGNDTGNGYGTGIGLGIPTAVKERKRVISLTRSHSHRLSGVEAWSEAHRHIVSPPDEDLHTILASPESGTEDGDHDNDNNNEINDDDYDGVVMKKIGRENEDVGVKESEAEEEAGIEAVLEQDVPLPVIPIEGSLDSIAAAAVGTTIGGGHSRTGSLIITEPKSSVIRVVEKKSSSNSNSKFGSTKSRKQKSNVSIGGEGGIGGEKEEEESMEALLKKSGVLPKGEEQERKVSGAEAWEIVNVDTMKHAQAVSGSSLGLGSGQGQGRGSTRNGNGTSSLNASRNGSFKSSIGNRNSGTNTRRNLEDVFGPLSISQIVPPPQPLPLPQLEVREEELRKREDEVEARERLYKLEIDLERKVDENKRICEWFKERLVVVEKRIEEEETKRKGVEVELEKLREKEKKRLAEGKKEKSRQEEEDGERERTQKEKQGNWSMMVVKNILTSKAVNVAGMVGLSRWLTVSSSSSTSSSSTSSPSSSTTKIEDENKKQTTRSTIWKFARMGASLSTFTIFLGIGMCVVLLRLLGKKPFPPVGAGVGVRRR